MDARELLVELERRGVELAISGRRLRYRPQHAVTPVLRVAMAERRDELLALLADEEEEVRWRADAMRSRVPATGPIPTLCARPATTVAPGCCLSCGERLPAGGRYRCDPCVKAAWRALREARVRPSGTWDGDG